jgi:hypothetical protein
MKIIRALVWGSIQGGLPFFPDGDHYTYAVEVGRSGRTLGTRRLLTVAHEVVVLSVVAV